MGKTKNLFGFARNLVRTSVALALCLFMAWTGVGRLMPCTPAGVQCPTAAVQLITAPIKNCCGHIVGYQTRAPRPGDKQFVQCRCAEKHAPTSTALFGSSLPYFTLLAPESIDLRLPLLPPFAVTIEACSAGIVERPTAPFIPPPSAA